MLLLALAIVGQIDPNLVYEQMERKDKDRIFLVYERELRSRQNNDSAFEATAQATSMPNGTVRLVVREMKIIAKYNKELQEEKKKDQQKNAATPGSGSRRSGSNRSPRPRRNNNPTIPKNDEDKNTGDGIRTETGREKIFLDNKEYPPFSFQVRCPLLLADQLGRVKEKIPFAIDGRISSREKNFTLIELMRTDGSTAVPLLVPHKKSIGAITNIDEGTLVRVFGWKALEDDVKETFNQEGTLFYVVGVDRSAIEISGLEIKPVITDAVEGGKPVWNVALEVKNNSDRSFENVELEANLVVEARKPNDAVDKRYFIITKVVPEETVLLKATMKGWGREIDNSSEESSESDESPSAQITVRTLAGKAVN